MFQWFRLRASTLTSARIDVSIEVGDCTSAGVWRQVMGLWQQHFRCGLSSRWCSRCIGLPHELLEFALLVGRQRRRRRSIEGRLRRSRRNIMYRIGEQSMVTRATDSATSTGEVHRVKRRARDSEKGARLYQHRFADVCGCLAASDATSCFRPLHRDPAPSSFLVFLLHAPRRRRPQRARISTASALACQSTFPATCCLFACRAPPSPGILSAAFPSLLNVPILPAQ